MRVWRYNEEIIQDVNMRGNVGVTMTDILSNGAFVFEVNRELEESELLTANRERVPKSYLP